MCPGHGHIKQQLALGTNCPSRVVMHQHVLDVKVLRYALSCVSVRAPYIVHDTLLEANAVCEGQA